MRVLIVDDEALARHDDLRRPIAIQIGNLDCRVVFIGRPGGVREGDAAWKRDPLMTSQGPRYEPEGAAREHVRTAISVEA